MEQEEVDGLALALGGAEDATLKEIIRQAESFLSAQLAAGIASDARAMTFAGVLGAVLTLLTGTYAALVAAKLAPVQYIIPASTAFVGFVFALILAALAARPTTFGYVGNSPIWWEQMLREGNSLHESRAAYAALCAKDIVANESVISSAHRYLKAAKACAFATLIVSAFVLAVIVGNGPYEKKGDGRSPEPRPASSDLVDRPQWRGEAWEPQARTR